jgi:hypothetical protein
MCRRTRTRKQLAANGHNATNKHIPSMFSSDMHLKPFKYVLYCALWPVVPWLAARLLLCKVSGLSGLNGVVCSLPMRTFQNCIDAMHAERDMIQVICDCNCGVIFCIEVLSDELA